MRESLSLLNYRLIQFERDWRIGITLLESLQLTLQQVNNSDTSEVLVTEPVSNTLGVFFIKSFKVKLLFNYSSKLTGKPEYALHITCFYPESFALSSDGRSSDLLTFEAFPFHMKK